ncbi:MAG: hypothetical protein P8126_08650 [Gammaproteobacteria bacterium]|jgi:anti-anti-sigma regulatory factor
MTVPTFTVTDPQPSDYESFTDGDKLIMMLPPVIDGHLYTEVRRELDNAGEDGIRQILFDCSSVERLSESGRTAFRKLGEFARDQLVRILILGASIEISEQLDQLLPRATWVDSYNQAGFRAVV